MCIILRTVNDAFLPVVVAAVEPSLEGKRETL